MSKYKTEHINKLHKNVSYFGYFKICWYKMKLVSEEQLKSTMIFSAYLVHHGKVVKKLIPPACFPVSTKLTNS